MALREFKEHFLEIQAQYLQMKADLADFDDAFAKGLITEDKLVEVKELVAVLEQNYRRTAYIAYLLEIPKKKEKHAKFKKRTKSLSEYFRTSNVDSEAIFAENKSALDQLRKELKRLTEDSK